MYEIVVLTHGKLAPGIYDSLSMIMGEQDSVHFASFTLDSSVEAFEDLVRSKFNVIDKDKQILFLSDLYGGTPNNVASRFKIENPERVEVISGVNLPILIASVLKKNENLIDTVNDIMQEYSNGCIRVVLNNKDDDE